jgi:hypothetical protein
MHWDHQPPEEPWFLAESVNSLFKFPPLRASASPRELFSAGSWKVGQGVSILYGPVKSVVGNFHFTAEDTETEHFVSLRKYSSRAYHECMLLKILGVRHRSD